VIRNADPIAVGSAISPLALRGARNERSEARGGRGGEPSGHSSALLAVLLLAAAPASARDFDVGGEPLRLDLTESLYLNWHGDPGNGQPVYADFGELFSRFNVQLARGGWLFSTRLDSAAYASVPRVGDTLAKPSCADCPPGRISDSRQLAGRFPDRLWDQVRGVEKATLSWTGGGVEVAAGDSYVVLGRGLVLSLRKVDELGIDTTLTGARVAVRRGPVQAVAAAGWTNSRNVDQAEALYVPDPNDLLGGAGLRWRIADTVVAGVQAAGGFPSANQSPFSKTDDRYLRYGASLDIPRLPGGVSLYAEYARAQDHVLDAAHDGGALYVAATAGVGGATFLLEAKDYRGYTTWDATGDRFHTVVYQSPPTLERVKMPFSAGSDITAARLRLDYRLDETLSFTGAVTGGQDRPSSVQNLMLGDAFVGTELRSADGHTRVAPLVEARHEFDPQSGALYKQILSCELDAMRMLTGQWSAEASGFLWLRREGPEIVPGSGDNAWAEAAVQLSVHRAPWGLAGVGFEQTTKLSEQGNQHRFLNAVLRWNLPGTGYVQLFVGGNRPGLRCVSGLCRIYPAFQGARLELVAQY